MAEEAVSGNPVVVLGFNAALGFASADQTSPALAGAAGALTDTTLTGEQVTELRIHGVSGSDAPIILEHPQALQVAGDGMAGVFRRWTPDGPGRPSVPWKLEAYSWSGLTRTPLASASWLLLAPFMMYNVAYFMLPPFVAGAESMTMQQPEPHLRRGRGHRIAHALLRLLALAATIQFVSAAATVTMSTAAWQAAGPEHLLLPSWMGWYGTWTAGWRVALAMASVVLIVILLWWVSVKTASKYEARTSATRPELNESWPLTQPGFWRGQALVARQRALHAAAALASVALIAVLPGDHPAAARWVAIILAAAVLAAVVVLVTLPMADRYTVSLANGGRPDGRADWWCRGVLAAALAVLVTSAVVRGLTDRQSGRQPGVLPGLTGFLAGLLVVQVALLIVLAVVVTVLARRAAGADADSTANPYLGGRLAVPVVALGFALGGLLTAVINIGVTRLLGTAGPSGFQFQPAPSDALAVPWPIYAFGAAPIGLLCGAIAAGIVLFSRYVRRHGQFGAPAGSGRSPVAAAYAGSTAGPGGGNGDDPAYAGNRRAIARTWAAGLIVDDADIAITLAVGGILVLVLAAEIAAAVYAGTTGHPVLLPDIWHGAASVVALVAITVVGWLVTLLRQAYSDPAKRKTIGALWDVGTFWPRAVHPLAPPSYAERAVPEVVDRIRLLTGHDTNAPDDIANLHYQAGLPGLDRTQGVTVPAGPLLLTGYSQGSIIASAAIAQLPPEILPDIALLTLACPARRPYGRAFPSHFGPRPLAQLASLLDAAPGQPAGRWKNLRRRSDYFGSFIFDEPDPSLDDANMHDQVDQSCLDPPVLVPDSNPTPPTTHRHDQWWPDLRTSEVGSYLVGLLSTSPRIETAAKPSQTTEAAQAST